MSYNPNGGMNDVMRRAGGRSRSLLPNIGQTPAVQAANQVLGQSQPPTGSPGPMASPSSPPPAMPQPMPSAVGSMSPGGPSPMAAPAVNPSTFTLHPPGSPPDPNQYNYEPQPDGAWRVYPPGVPAPGHMYQASLPRAASTADYQRMRQAFQQVAQQPRQQ